MNYKRTLLSLSFCALASLAATAQQLFSACAAHGGKAWDHSALVRALETLANFQIGGTVPQ